MKYISTSPHYPTRPGPGRTRWVQPETWWRWHSQSSGSTSSSLTSDPQHPPSWWWHNGRKERDIKQRAERITLVEIRMSCQFTGLVTRQLHYMSFFWVAFTMEQRKQKKPRKASESSFSKTGIKYRCKKRFLCKKAFNMQDSLIFKNKVCI